jgi:hypothetical protein
MVKDVRMQVEFTGMRQGFPCDVLQLVHGDEVVTYEKNNILKVSIQATIQFAKGNAVWVGNADLKVSKLTNEDTAFIASFWQRDKPFERDELDMDL